MSDVIPRAVAWLWFGVIPLGKVTLFAGYPGQGKSFATMDIAARVTRGLPFPGCVDGRPPGDVLLLNAEEDAADVIRPRLDAAGADPKRVHQLLARADGSPPTLGDIVTLMTVANDFPELRLIVVDPISAFLGSVEENANAEVRRLLAEVVSFAEEREIAVLCISHFNKNAQGQVGMHRVIGSQGFVAVARSLFLLGPDPENPDRRLLLPEKANLAKDPVGYAFRISEEIEEGLFFPSLEWESEPVEADANSLLASTALMKGSGGTKLNEAIEMVRGHLSNGPVPSKELADAARDAGIKDGTRRRAEARLKVQKAKAEGVKNGPWYVSLPPEEDHESSRPGEDERLDYLPWNQPENYMKSPSRKMRKVCKAKPEPGLEDYAPRTDGLPPEF